MALILLNKPYGVICQFSREGGKPTLADFIRTPDVYPAGRLDTDSEGLLLLTDDGALQHSISSPKAKMPKSYWVQVEGRPDRAALERLAAGVDLGDFVTRPAKARVIEEPPGLWPRDPPVRYRAAIPTSWLELEITEGKNRQVRRMTAAVGYPTLRLIRHRVGPYSLDDLQPGQSRTEIATPAAPRAPRAAVPRAGFARNAGRQGAGPRGASPRGAVAGKSAARKSTARAAASSGTRNQGEARSPAVVPKSRGAASTPFSSRRNTTGKAPSTRTGTGAPTGRPAGKTAGKFAAKSAPRPANPRRRPK